MKPLFDTNRFYTTLLMLGTLLFAACRQDTTAPAERTKYIIPDSVMKTLTIDTVRLSLHADAITLNGMVDFNQDNQVNIYPPVSGNIENLKVQLGDYVKAGDVLAVVKSSEMAGYSNNLVVAETNVTNTKKQLDAQEELYKSGLSSSLDITAAKANYEQAQAQLEMARRILKINGNNTNGDYVIKAPISGFIVQKNVTNNTVIRTDNGNNLFTISDLKNVWVQANVYESNIGNVHLNDEVTVTTLAYPDHEFHGRVDKIMNVLDPSNKVMKIRIVLQNPDYALKPQMFTSVTISSQGTNEELTIPSSALIFDHSQYYVLKYNGKEDVKITPVQLLNKMGQKTYLVSGVQKGDRIIATHALLIYDALNN